MELKIRSYCLVGNNNHGLQHSETKVWLNEDKWGFTHFDKVQSGSSLDYFDFFSEKRNSLFINFGVEPENSGDFIKLALKRTVDTFYEKFCRVEKVGGQPLIKIGALEVTDTSVIDLFSVVFSKKSKTVMEDISAEGFDDHLQYIQVNNLVDTMKTIDSIKKTTFNKNSRSSFLIRLQVMKLNSEGEVPMLMISQLFLPSMKKGGLIASELEFTERSQEEIVIIKDSRDLDNLETRISNPSWGSSKLNTSLLRFKNMESEKSQQPESPLLSETKQSDKASAYLNK